MDPYIFVFFCEKIFAVFCWTEVASVKVVKVHLESQHKPSGGRFVKIHNCDVVLMQCQASVSGTRTTDKSASKRHHNLIQLSCSLPHNFVETNRRFT